MDNSIEGIAFRYSEWLDGEGLIRGDTATDKRTHDDLAHEFAAHEAARS